MTDYKVIYLAPPCYGDERMWCEHDAPDDCECIDGPHPWIKYTSSQLTPDDVDANKAGGLWYRRWFKAINEGNELRALLNEAEEYVADACDAMEHSDGRDLLNRINAALEARGLEIREKGNDLIVVKTGWCFTCDTNECAHIQNANAELRAALQEKSK